MPTLKTAKDVLASNDVVAVVDFAIENDRIAKAATKEVEAVKGFIRDAGKAGLLAGASNVNLEGTLGVAQVVFPASTPVIKKGVDAEAALKGIPEGIFGLLFTKQVVVKVEPVSDFEAKLKAVESALTPEQRAVLAAAVEITQPTPRVNLPK